MTPNTVPHFCGGIFFDLLLEARKVRKKAKNRFSGGSDGLSIPDIFAGLIEVVTGDDMSSVAGETMRKCATNYRKCLNSTGTYVPFTKESTQRAFHYLYEKEKTCLLERMASFIEKYLNKDLCVWLVSALIETMQNAQNVDDDTEISINFTQTLPVSKLHTTEHIILLPFLLSILHYVILNCPDCESGKATFTAWYIQERPRAEWKIKKGIGSTIPVMTIHMDLTIPQTDQEPSIIVEEPYKEMSDHEVITDSLIRTMKIFADGLGNAEHQLAEQIRQNQKKQVPPEEEPTKEEAVADENSETEQVTQPATVHQTIVNQYGDHPVHIDHVENLKL